MGVPTQEELQAALQEAVRMREGGDDPYCLAKSLLNFNYRMKLLEDVMSRAKLYLRSGQSSTEHANLKKAIEKAEQAGRIPGDDQHIS